MRGVETAVQGGVWRWSVSSLTQSCSTDALSSTEAVVCREKKRTVMEWYFTDESLQFGLSWHPALLYLILCVHVFSIGWTGLSPSHSSVCVCLVLIFLDGTLSWRSRNTHFAPFKVTVRRGALIQLYAWYFSLLLGSRRRKDVRVWKARHCGL